MRTKAATKDLGKFLFVGNVWLLSDPLITRSPGYSDSFLPSGVTHLGTVHCLILGTASQAGDIRLQALNQNVEVRLGVVHEQNSAVRNFFMGLVRPENKCSSGLDP